MEGFLSKPLKCFSMSGVPQWYGPFSLKLRKFMLTISIGFLTFFNVEFGKHTTSPNQINKNMVQRRKMCYCYHLKVRLTIQKFTTNNFSHSNCFGIFLLEQIFSKKLIIIFTNTDSNTSSHSASNLIMSLPPKLFT